MGIFEEFGAKELRLFLKALYRTLCYRKAIDILPLSSEILNLHEKNGQLFSLSGDDFTLNKDTFEWRVGILVDQIEKHTEGVVQFLRLENKKGIIERYKDIEGYFIEKDYSGKDDIIIRRIGVGLAMSCLRA